MKHVSSMGGIWRMSERAFKRLKRDIREGRNINLDDYGRMILSDPVDLNDLQDEAQWEAEEEGA